MMLPGIVLTSFIATLFSMMNPIGSLGIFASMTADLSVSQSRKIAMTCTLATVITLLIVTWFGSSVLTFFGISIASLRTAGGIIILLIGINMLFNKSDHKSSADELADAKKRSSIAVVPLAIPIIAGPGTMAAVLVTCHQHVSLVNKLELSLVILGMSLFTGVLLFFARPISNFIGKSGMGVVTRVMGLILTAIAMDLFSEGLKVLLPGLAS